jgi:hypothetical protein
MSIKNAARGEPLLITREQTEANIDASLEFNYKPLSGSMDARVLVFHLLDGYFSP